MPTKHRRATHSKDAVEADGYVPDNPGIVPPATPKVRSRGRPRTVNLAPTPEAAPEAAPAKPKPKSKKATKKPKCVQIMEEDVNSEDVPTEISDRSDVTSDGTSRIDLLQQQVAELTIGMSKVMTLLTNQYKDGDS